MKTSNKQHVRRRAFAAVFVVLAIALLAPPSHAVQLESQEEKEANLKKQATGGLFHNWTFDKDQPNALPAGFVGRVSGGGPPGTWVVQPDDSAPSRPNVVAVRSQCGRCYQLLMAEGLDYEYPDVAVRFRGADGKNGKGGVVFGAKDPANFYAAIVDVKGQSAQVIRVVEGRETVLAEAAVKFKPVDWHSLRVQRNTIISKDFIETFVDGTLVLSVEDQTLGLGQVGLAAAGESSLLFDTFHAVPLFSHRPLSAPAAY